MNLNIGGGAYAHDGWSNLDATTGFRLTPECCFPHPIGSVPIIYSSHALEHLDDATVARTLDEARRVIERHGTLVIKIPRFTEIQERWLYRDDAWFHDPAWNFDAVVPTWKNRDVADTINARAAYMFCGFWNKAFGDLYGTYDVTAEGAYNGPPVLPDGSLAEILGCVSPHGVAATLALMVRHPEPDFTFNHQNAWSVMEFMALLREHGFEPIPRSRVVPAVREIPGIADMAAISAYFVAEAV